MSKQQCMTTHTLCRLQASTSLQALVGCGEVQRSHQGTPCKPGRSKHLQMDIHITLEKGCALRVPIEAAHMSALQPITA
jgi:hypothetical protein